MVGVIQVSRIVMYNQSQKGAPLKIEEVKEEVKEVKEDIKDAVKS